MPIWDIALLYLREDASSKECCGSRRRVVSEGIGRVEIEMDLPGKAELAQWAVLAAHHLSVYTPARAKCSLYADYSVV